MDDARKLLDSLMGPSRDAGKEEQRRSDGWKERNVCKRYLVGFCPNNSQDNWFKNTRRDLIIGTCDKIHSDRLKEQFLEHPDRHRYEPEYTKDFLRFLEGMVFEADAWIGREGRNCKPAGKEVRIPPEIWTSIEDMTKQSEQLLKNAEELAEKGQIAASKLAQNSSTQLVEDIDGIKAKYTFNSGGEEVCKVCGVRCQPGAPGESADYQAHLDGKLHLGYSQVREKVKELREIVKQYSRGEADPRSLRDNGRERGRDSHRGGERGDGSDKGGHGDKERDNNVGDRDRGNADRAIKDHADTEIEAEGRGDKADKDRADQDRGEKDRGDKDRGNREREAEDRGDKDRDRRGREGRRREGRDSRDDPPRDARDARDGGDGPRRDIRDDPPRDARDRRRDGPPRDGKGTRRDAGEEPRRHRGSRSRSRRRR